MKKLLFLLFLFPNLLVAQQPTFNIESNFGYKYLHITNILPTDSCYYLNGVITDTSNQQYNFGSLFLKISLTGDSVLAKKLVAPSKDWLTWTGLLNSPDGVLVTAGESDDTVETIFLMKYTPEGDTLWTREYLNPSDPGGFIAPMDIKSRENGYYLTATYSIATSTKNRTVVLKLDESGNLLQQKTYGNVFSELPGSTIVEPDDGLIIGVCRTNHYNFSQSNIFQVDSLGNVLWQYLSSNTELIDVPYSMVKTSDGGLVVASGKGVEYMFSGTSFLLWNGYIFKLNADHQFAWGRELRGTRPDGGSSLVKVVPATDGAGFVACGNVGEDKTFGEEKYGSWVVKVSNQGDSLWARYYTFIEGIDNYYEPADFKATPDGGYIISGHKNKGLENFGWLMKLDSFGCLIPGCNANDGPNAATEQAAEMKLAIYPNPTADFLNFELRAPQLPQKARFRIYDANGRLVKEFVSDSPKDTFIVPVRDWAAGVYYLQYEGEGEVRAVERFVVNKK